MFKRYSRLHAGNHSKATHRRVTRGLRLEPLEPRQLLTGVTFESVMALGDGVRPTSVYGGVAVDETGNRYVAGYFQGTVDFDPDNAHTGDADTLQSIGNAENAFVAKYGPTGLLRWVQAMGGAATQTGQNARSRSLAIDAEGNVYVAGTFQATVDLGGFSLTSAGADDAFVARLDSASGSVDWAHRWGDQGSDSITDDSLAAGPGPSAYLTLTSGGQTNVLKFDADQGEILWQRNLDWGNRLIVDNTGNVFVAGGFQAPFDADPGPGTHMVNHDPAPMSTFVLKLDAAGDFAWVRILEAHPASGSSTLTTLLSMTLDNSGSVILGGDYFGTVDFDPSAEVFLSLPAQLHRYVAKFNSDGQLAWASPLIGEATPKPGEASSTLNIALLTDSVNNIYASGNFRGVVDFDAGAGSVVFTSQATGPNAFDSYLMSLSADGEFRWATTLGNADASVSIIAVDVDSSNSLHVGGSFYGPGPVDFDPGSAMQPLSSAARSGFVLTLNPVTNDDNDPPPTKFYVVNDAAHNLTYEYSPTGALIESHSLHSSNTTPRGAASTTAGDKTWVVDANKKVYVYDNSGALLGAWTAGTLTSTATVQGIATNGTDIWIVDAKSDKVYRYAGAATRLSGTQNATSSFNLNGSNKDATDIVQGGGFLWVTNNTSFTDKVFKYALSGSLVGSWTISAGGGSPTGITIDPSSVSDVWIVDSATDRVYQYTAAASRTSGSQSAATSFPLAPGNTNPQGIADPPPSASTVSFESPNPSKLDANTAAALARSTAGPETMARPLQKTLAAPPVRHVVPVPPPHLSQQAIDSALDGVGR